MGCSTSTPVPIAKSAPARDYAVDTPQYPKELAPHTRTRPDAIRAIQYAQTGPASKETRPPESFVAMMQRAVARHGDSPALRTERPLPPLDANGKAPPALPENEWKTWTWEQYYTESREVAKGLIALGVERMEGVTVYGFNSPEWLMSQLAITMAGGLTAGIYPTDNADSVAYKTVHCGARVAIVEDATKVDRYQQVINDVAKLSAIVVFAPGYDSQSRTLQRADGSMVKILSWQDVRTLGSAATDDVVNERIAALKPEQAATLIYTSGTTGKPKAVMVTHDNMVFASSLITLSVPTLGAAGQERIVSYLPLSHIAGLIADCVFPIHVTANCAGYGTTYFARNYDLKVGSLVDRLRAVRPTLFFGVPRVYEKIHEKMAALGAQTKGFKKLVVNNAKQTSLAYQRALQLGGSGAVPSGLARADRMVLSKIKVALGLDAAKLVLTGAAPLQMVTAEYFGSIGININETYGMSENTGGITANTDEYHVWGSVGYAAAGCHVKVVRREGDAWVEAKVAADLFHPTEDEQGELCYKGRNIMLGYMSSEAVGDEADVAKKNAEAVDDEGYLHSGDKGCVNAQGMFRVTGRYKELIIGSGGENIAPVPIEDRIMQLAPAISKAVMIGDKRKFNVMLITLKQEGTTGETPGTGALTGPALTVSLGSATTEQAIQDPAWEAYLTTALDQVNKDGSVVVSHAYRVEKFMILPRDFSMEGGELTATMKLKRNVVDQKYKANIDAMFEETATGKYVKFRDVHV